MSRHGISAALAVTAALLTAVTVTTPGGASTTHHPSAGDASRDAPLATAPTAFVASDLGSTLDNYPKQHVEKLPW